MADQVIPEEIVEKGAAADYAGPPSSEPAAQTRPAGAQVAREQATGRAASTVPGWDAMLGDATAVLDRAHSYLSTRDLAADVLSAALAGRQVVDLPEPDDTADDIRDDTAWDLGTGEIVRAFVEDGAAYVSFMFTDTSPADAEQLGLTLIAAAREARRLAAGSGSGED